MDRPLAIYATPRRPDANASQRIFGLNVFMQEWIRAMAEYRSLPDQLHFFVAPHELEATEQVIMSWPPHWRSEVLAFSIDELPQQLRRVNYLAVHYPGGPRLGEIATLIHGLTGAPTPVTANHHSLSYGEMLGLLQSELLSDVQPYDAIVAPSPASMRAHQTLLRELEDWVSRRHGVAIRSAHQWYLIPHGVSTESFAPGDRRVARQIAGLPQEGICLIVSGRISAMDKADLLPVLRIIAELGPSAPDLVVVGDDARHESTSVTGAAATLGIGHKVHVFGSVNPQMLRILYHSADVALFPFDSIQESFGLVASEAMASGLPCIASDWDGLRAIVKDGETGRLIPTAFCLPDEDQDALWVLPEMHQLLHLMQAQTCAVDYEFMRTAIRSTVDDAPLWRRMGTAALDHVQNSLAWRVVIPQYERMWAELQDQAGAMPRQDRRSASALAIRKAFAHYGTTELRGSVVVSSRRAESFGGTWDRWLSRIPFVSRCVPSTAAHRVFEWSEQRRTVNVASMTVAERMAVQWLRKQGFITVQSLEGVPSDR